MRVVHTQTKDPTKRNLMKHEPALRIANKKKAGSSCFYVTKKKIHDPTVGILVFFAHRFLSYVGKSATVAFCGMVFCDPLKGESWPSTGESKGYRLESPGYCWCFLKSGSPVDIENIPCFTGFDAEVVQDFFHQQYVHPGGLTWNIIMEVWKIIFLSKWVIWRFHVYLPGCTYVIIWYMWVFCRLAFLKAWNNPALLQRSSHRKEIQGCRPWMIAISHGKRTLSVQGGSFVGAHRCGSGEVQESRANQPQKVVVFFCWKKGRLIMI